jgi:hypothetical protein
MTLRVPKATIIDKLLKLIGLKRDFKVSEKVSEVYEKFGPYVDATLEKESVATTLNKNYPDTKLDLWYLGAVYVFLLLVWASQQWGGNLPFLFIAFFFCFVIAKKLVKLELMIKEVRVSAVMEESSEWYKRILNWQIYLKIGCWILALFISISFFLFFYTTGPFYKLVIFLDALVIIWLTRKLKLPFTKHLKEQTLNLIGEFAANFLNIFILFVIFVIYSLFFERLPSGFDSGTLDANIPLWVRDNIRHSCDIFEKLLRLNVSLRMTIDNAICLESWIHYSYRLFNLLTMSFWPFLGITLFYRFFLTDKPQLPFMNRKKHPEKINEDKADEK